MYNFKGVYVVVNMCIIISFALHTCHSPLNSVQYYNVCPRNVIKITDIHVFVILFARLHCLHTLPIETEATHQNQSRVL